MHCEEARHNKDRPRSVEKSPGIKHKQNMRKRAHRSNKANLKRKEGRKPRNRRFRLEPPPGFEPGVFSLQG